MRIVILGVAGMIGREIAADLAADRAVSEIVGCSPSLVTRHRNELGIAPWRERHGGPKAGGKGRKNNMTPWTDAEIAMLGTDTDKAVGKALGRPGSSVFQKRKSLGIVSKFLPCVGTRTLRSDAESNGDAAKVSGARPELFGYSLPAGSVK